MTSGYWLFLLMIIPVAAGIFFWIKYHTIDWWEALTSVGCAALISALCIFGGKSCQGHETYTVSGKIYKVEHTPYWHARWRERESYTVTVNKKTVTRWRTVTKTRDYPPSWTAVTTIGSFTMSEGYFDQIAARHGLKKERGHRPNFNRGDRFDYYSNINDNNDFCDYPVTDAVGWVNPLRGKGSIVEVKSIDEKEAKRLRLPEYPENEHYSSSRLIDSGINIWNWDKMVTSLGGDVNLILVDFHGGSMDAAHKLQGYWKNGKRNDLVLCRGEGWSYVFGWTKSELVKLNLQTILLDNPANDAIIPLIKDEVRKNFKPHDWSKYDNMPAPVPTGFVVLAFVLMILSQVGCYYLFHNNEHDKVF